MNIGIRHFSGTGNSRIVARIMARTFRDHGHAVDDASILTGNGIGEDADLLGFCCPVYAFGIPRICRRFLEALPRSGKRRRAFVVVTVGKADESGFATAECAALLASKGIEVVHSAVVPMPNNWVTACELQPQEEVATILENGYLLAENHALAILRGDLRLHRVARPGGYGPLAFRAVHQLFAQLGARHGWKLFEATAACTGCRRCERACPTGSLRIEGGRPRWSASCEQCMRCANLCPRSAIRQRILTRTPPERRYLEPNLPLYGR